MDIKRWGMDWRKCSPFEWEHGTWVHLPDHERLVRALQEEVERLQGTLSEERRETERLFRSLGGARF